MKNKSQAIELMYEAINKYNESMALANGIKIEDLRNEIKKVEYMQKISIGLMYDALIESGLVEEK
jgi:hypothetical protein